MTMRRKVCSERHEIIVPSKGRAQLQLIWHGAKMACREQWCVASMEIFACRLSN